MKKGKIGRVAFKSASFVSFALFDTVSRSVLSVVEFEQEISSLVVTMLNSDF